MKKGEYPVYYQEMEAESLDSQRSSKKTKGASRVNQKVRQPKVFYKAISKIIAFGINEK